MECQGEKAWKKGTRCRVCFGAKGALDRAEGDPRPVPRRRIAGRRCAGSARAEHHTPQALKTFASQTRRRMRTEAGSYRRDHLRALAQRVEVDVIEVRIIGSKSVLLRILVAASSAKTAVLECPVWYRSGTREDSNSLQMSSRHSKGPIS